MSFFKKTAAAILASATALQWQALAADIWLMPEAVSNYAGYEYQAPAALKKLVRLDTKIVTVLDNSAKKEIAKIRDPKLKKYYSELNAAKKSELRSLFSGLRSGMRYEFLTAETENAKDMVRFAVKGYSEFIQEIRYVSGKNAVTEVTADEKASVEAEVVNFQRDLIVTPLRKAIDTYAKSDVKETGEWKGSFSSPFGTVNASIDKYTNVLSILGLSQEADFVFNSDFDLDLPGPVRYDPETYERVASPSVKLKGAVKVGANVKLVDNYAYVLLRDYSVDVATSATGSAAEEFDAQLAQAKAALSLMKGKTVKITMPEENAKTRPDVVIKKATEVLDILASNSLLTPSRKIGEGKFALALNAKTAYLVSNVFDEKMTTADVRRADKEFAASGLSMTMKNGISTIRTVDAGGSWEASMTRDANGYAFHLDNVEGKSRTVLDVSKTAITFAMKSKTADVLGTWNDGATSLVVTAMGTEAFKLTGTVTTKKIDVAIAVTGKQVGTVKFSQTDKAYSSDIRFEFDVPAGMMEKSGKFVITSSESGTLETGTFKIDVPKDVIDIEALIGSKAESLLK